MPSFAGINLIQPTPELTAYVERTIPLRDVVNFRPAGRLNKLNIALPYSDARDRPIKLGSLWWPTGASRWAQGFFLASESQLTQIRAAGAGTTARPLNISDGTTSISPYMTMLPPRPLVQNPVDAASFAKWLLPKADAGTLGEALYLLTLVDDRYNWQDKGANITVTEGTTTWAALFAAIATGLGITLTTDSISAAYLKPPAALSAYQENLALLLDVCAFSVGHRVVRLMSGVNGVVVTQSATTALASVTAQLAANTSTRGGGGLFAFDNS